MYHNLAVKITSFLVKYTKEKKCDTDVMIYGAELLISSLIELMILFIIGLVCGCLLETLVFLLFFCPLRKVAGGYHAPNYTLCTLIFSLYFMLLVNFSLFMSIYIQILIVITSSLVILIFAPVEDENKPLDIECKLRLKVAIKRYLLIDLCLYTIMLVINRRQRIITFIVYALGTVGFLLLLGFTKNKRKGKINHEKKEYE